MVNDPIPEDVRDFIVRHIDSIAQLEALLLLRAAPGGRWSSATVAARLYVDEAQATAILTRLHADGFLAGDGTSFHYAASGTDLDVMVGRLAALYAQHLIPVTNLIHAKPSRIREFASAFKLRKDFMIAAVIYTLCALTALLCAVLLLAAYGRSRYRLLLWSGLCFAGLTLNNLLLVMDKLVFPNIDFSLWRSLSALIAMVILLYGLIWDAE